MRSRLKKSGSGILIGDPFMMPELKFKDYYIPELEGMVYKETIRYRSVLELFYHVLT